MDEPPPELVRHLAYGEVSWMLLETLLSLLTQRGVLSREDVLTALETVRDAKQASVRAGNDAEISRVAAGMLSTLNNSLAADHESHGVG